MTNSGQVRRDLAALPHLIHTLALLGSQAPPLVEGASTDHGPGASHDGTTNNPMDSDTMRPCGVVVLRSRTSMWTQARTTSE